MRRDGLFFVCRTTVYGDQPTNEAVMDRRCFLKRLFLIAVSTKLPLLGGCSTSVDHLVLAIHPWVGYETLYLAREFKWLPDSVELAEKKTLSDSFAALQSGRADGACMTLDEMLRARASGIPLSVAMVFDVSAGADMVLARPDIDTPADLAGKRLGLEQNALGALMLQKLLEAAEIPEKSLELIELPPDRQLDAWRKKEVDAIITYEPTATLLMQQGAHRLFDSRQIPDTIFDVLAVRTDRVRDVSLVQALVAAHFRALEHIRTYRQDALYRISVHGDLSVEEVQQVLAGVTMPTLEANRGYLLGPDSRLISAARSLSSMMVRYGLLAQEDNLAGLIMPDTLPSGDY
jgi:NitT/TauT family transport system substrate-binding protein